MVDLFVKILIIFFIIRSFNDLDVEIVADSEKENISKELY